MQDQGDATILIGAGLVDRNISRVLIDFSVTLQFADDGPAAELKLECSFAITTSAGSQTIEPERMVEGAQMVVGLFGARVLSVRVDQGSELVVDLSDERRLRAWPDAQYESWSYTSEDGSRVICMPGGQVAIWSPQG
jgi:hypothetical protein